MDAPPQTQPPSPFVGRHGFFVVIVIAVSVMSAAMCRLILFRFAATAWTLPSFDSRVRKNVDALARAVETGRPSGPVSYSTLPGIERA